MHNIEFFTPHHFETFKQLARRLDHPGDVDKKYFAALYVISGNERVRDMLLPYIDLENGRFGRAILSTKTRSRKRRSFSSNWLST